MAATDRPTAGKPFNPWRGACGLYVPDIVARQRDLTDGQKRLYERLVRWAGKNGACWYGYETMAEALGKGVRQVKSDVATLEAYGLIAHERFGKRLANRYYFLWHGVFDEVQPTAQHQQSEVQPTALYPPESEVQDTPGEVQDRAEVKCRIPSSEVQPTAHELYKESHHQKLRKESEKIGRGVVRRTARHEKPASESQKANDENRTPRVPLPSPEMEFEARMVERHGPVVDPRMLLAQIKDDLGDISLPDFLAADITATTAPGRLSNPAGHYRRLAKNLARAKGTGVVESAVATAEQALAFVAVHEQPYIPPCGVCKDGLLPDGAYCDCKVGETRRALDAMRATTTEAA